MARPRTLDRIDRLIVAAGQLTDDGWALEVETIREALGGPDVDRVLLDMLSPTFGGYAARMIDRQLCVVALKGRGRSK